jgi:hypothetical protein
MIKSVVTHLLQAIMNLLEEYWRTKPQQMQVEEKKDAMEIDGEKKQEEEKVHVTLLTPSRKTLAACEC